VIATRQAPSVAVEPVGIQVFSFEISIDSFSAGACGATARRGLDHHQWGLVLLRHFRRR
jgi:hypothetical protein